MRQESQGLSREKEILQLRKGETADDMEKHMKEIRKELEEVDLFVHGADVSAEQETRVYETLGPRLAEGAVVVSERAHESDALLDFANASGRPFLAFAEAPADHWHPGRGLGVCWDVGRA